MSSNINTNIINYNNYLIETQKQIDIIEYVKEVNKIEYNIDIDFINNLIDLVSKNECCIHHNLLQKYGILSLKSGSTDIKNLIKQYEFIDNEDYQIRNVSELRPQGGTSIKKNYYLHPRAFKICLMRSLKTKKYARYYLLLEECIKYYNDYQKILKEKYFVSLIEKNKLVIKEKDDKIDILLKNNDELINRSRKMELQLNEALERLELTNDRLDDTKDELDITSEKLDIIGNKLNIAVEDRVVKTRKQSLLEYFVIMKNPNATYKYYVIRGQKRYITKKKEELAGYTEIKTLECVPNASTLWNLVKENLRNINFMGNKINLVDITEDDFITSIEEIYNERKNI
jgi:phage anti-repressor protein